MPHPGVPRDWFRNKDGMGLWEGRGKVVATGIGTSPTARRWDEKPETSMGAMTIIAIRKAIADAGISPDEIDGLVLTPESTTGVSNDPNTPTPPGWEQHFKMASPCLLSPRRRRWREDSPRPAWWFGAGTTWPAATMWA